jgi:GT2 family glycosyltransferase
MSRPYVYVVMPIHDRLGLTLACLESFAAQTYKDHLVIVVDGGSTDGSAPAIRRDHPDVAVLPGDGDLWWAGATNLGVKLAMRVARSDDFVLTMNNDSAVDVDYLSVLVAAAKTHPRTLIGSVAVDHEDRQKVVDGGVRYDWLRGRRIASFLGLSLAAFRRRWPEGREVDVLPGRGTLVPMRVFHEIGLFDDRRLPHYGADYEFSRRAFKAGYALLVQYVAPVWSRPAETGLNAALRDVTLWQFVLSFVSRRSPNNLWYRLVFAAKSCPPYAVVPFYLLGTLRILFGGLLRIAVRQSNNKS